MNNCTTNNKVNRIRLFASIAVLALTATASHAQLNVGSNAVPNAGAMLEVTSTNRGLLLPRVSIASTTVWGLNGTGTAGMTVYNTNASITATDVYPKNPDGVGLYYWDGTGWVPTTDAVEIGTETQVAYVNVPNPNTGGALFYVETDDDELPVNDNLLKQSATTLYVANDGSTWVWNGSAYVTKAVKNSKDHDWYLAGTPQASGKAPRKITDPAYAMGARGIGIISPAYKLDVRNNKAVGTTPVSGAMVANFQNATGNVALRLGNNTGRFYLGRTKQSSAYGDLPGNTIFLGQHNVGSGANLAFGTGFGTAAPNVNFYLDNTTTGNVGIGTTNVTAGKLNVAGGSVVVTDDKQGYSLSSRLGGMYRTVGDGSAGGQDVGVRAAGAMLFISDDNRGAGPVSPTQCFYWGSGDTSAKGANFVEHMRLTTTGNLGLGVNDPTAKLDVAGSTAGTNSLQLRSGNNTVTPTLSNQILFGYGGSDQYRHAIKTRHHSGQQATNAIDFYVWNQGVDVATTVGTKQIMTLDGTGNVGIGTTAPHASLHFANGTVSNTENRRIVLYENADNEHQFYGFGINSGILRYQTAGQTSDHVFYSANSATTSDELMRIKGDGRVGIGTSTPSATLNVAGEIEAYVGASRTGQFYEGNSSKPGGQLFASATDAYFAVERPGGISQAGWAGYFARSNYFAGTTGFLSFVINGSQLGQIFANTNSSVFYATTSDIRLKENIRNSELGLADVMKIDVRDYNYKKDTTKALQTGFIAQQLYTVFPQAVYVGGEDADKSPWQVDYSKLTPLLTKAIQEQQVQIDALTKTNAALTAQVADLKDKEVAYAQLNERVKQMEQMIGINTRVKSKPSVGIITKKK